MDDKLNMEVKKTKTFAAKADDTKELPLTGSSVPWFTKASPLSTMVYYVFIS